MENKSKGIYWFIFICMTAFFGWAGNKVFKIENSEARLNVVEATLIANATKNESNAKDVVEYKTTVIMINDRLKRIEDKVDLIDRSSRAVSKP